MIGLLLKKRMPERVTTIYFQAIGLFTLAIGASMAIEMESCELYTLARLYGVEALTLLTVSDSLLSGEVVPPKERQTTFDSMVLLALSTLFA